MSMVAGLPASSPFCQSVPVASKKDFIWAHIMPNRVGNCMMLVSCDESQSLAWTVAGQ